MVRAFSSGQLRVILCGARGYGKSNQLPAEKLSFMKSELSDSLFSELKQQSPDREKALAAYRKRDVSWDEMVEPVAFLRQHELVDDDGKPGPGFLQSWPGLVLVVMLLAGFAISIFAFDLKFFGYFTSLFSEKKTRAAVSLTARPEKISVSGFPREYRDQIQEINSYNEKEQWKPAAEKGMALLNDKAAMNVIRGESDAHALLYEVVMGSKMALRSGDLSNERAVLDLADEFRREGGKTTLKIAFQELLARFEIAGGEGVGFSSGRHGNDEQVIAGCNALENHYGTLLSNEQKTQLRKIRVHSLIRLLEPFRDLAGINRNAEAKEMMAQAGGGSSNLAG